MLTTSLTYIQVSTKSIQLELKKNGWNLSGKFFGHIQWSDGADDRAFEGIPVRVKPIEEGLFILRRDLINLKMEM